MPTVQRIVTFARTLLPSKHQ